MVTFYCLQRGHGDPRTQRSRARGIHGNVYCYICSADTEIPERNVHVLVDPDGNVIWIPHRIYRSSCSVDVGPSSRSTARSVHHGTRSVRHETWSVRHGPRSIRHETCSVRHEIKSLCHGARSVRHESRSVRHESRLVCHETKYTMKQNQYCKAAAEPGICKHAVVDPVFPRGGTNSQLIILPHFPPQTVWKSKNFLSKGGVHSWCPLNSPLMREVYFASISPDLFCCRSVTLSLFCCYRSVTLSFFCFYSSVTWSLFYYCRSVTWSLFCCCRSVTWSLFYYCRSVTWSLSCCCRSVTWSLFCCYSSVTWSLFYYCRSVTWSLSCCCRSVTWSLFCCYRSVIWSLFCCCRSVTWSLSCCCRSVTLSFLLLQECHLIFVLLLQECHLIFVLLLQECHLIFFCCCRSVNWSMTSYRLIKIQFSKQLCFVVAGVSLDICFVVAGVSPDLCFVVAGVLPGIRLLDSQQEWDWPTVWGEHDRYRSGNVLWALQGTYCISPDCWCVLWPNNM